MLLVGLTGSIGMGKSTTAKMFKKFGYGVYNADDAVHYIYENDQKVIDQIEQKVPNLSIHFLGIRVHQHFLLIIFQVLKNFLLLPII